MASSSTNKDVTEINPNHIESHSKDNNPSPTYSVSSGNSEKDFLRVSENKHLEEQRSPTFFCIKPLARDALDVHLSEPSSRFAEDNNKDVSKSLLQSLNKTDLAEETLPSENKNEPKNMDISDSTENSLSNVNSLTTEQSQLPYSSSMSLCMNEFLPLNELGMGSSTMLQLSVPSQTLSPIAIESPSKLSYQTNVIKLFDTTENENTLKKRAEMKQIFLEETMKWEIMTDTRDTSDAVPQINKSNRGSVCQKCLNLDGKNTPCLDLSVFKEFEKFATFKDVVEARKKRKMVKELEKELLVDQNVEAPDIRFLWENKMNESRIEEIVPTVDIPEKLLFYYPISMGIEYLLNNKISTEYTMWKYFVNYFYIGAVALRHTRIPSIRIHVKFDMDGPKKADELGIPLYFKEVFVEECPIYMRNISAKNYLKHQHALALLPRSLITILSDSNNIFKALEQMDKWFNSVVAKVNELELLTIECGAFLKMSERQCYIEKMVCDVQRYAILEFKIKLAKIDDVGPRNVFFQPACETTDEFKNLSTGLPFLREFLTKPERFLVPFVKYANV